MNTGIGDAVNLAWKLAAALRGSATESLLDSYEPERISFARRLVRPRIGYSPLPQNGVLSRRVSVEPLSARRVHIASSAPGAPLHVPDRS
jgi:2-polyprenyl-6-methoxyphenol hydroxylase-like FAD-dependent oxidoreductase